MSLVKAITPAQYQAFKRRVNAISQSDLKELIRNAHKWRYGPPRKQTRALTFGTLFDVLLLSPTEFDATFEVCPFDSLKASGAAAWKKEAEKTGKLIARSKPTKTEPGVEQAKAAVESFIAAPDLEPVTQLLRDGDCVTQSAMAYELDGQVVCALIDIAPALNSQLGDALVDVKTTSKFSREQYAKSVADYGWHFQGATYLDIWNAVTGENRTRFFHAVQSTEDQGEQALIEIDPEAIDIGREELKEALSYHGECKRSGVWPGAFRAGEVVGLPHWYKPFRRAAA